MTATLAQLAAWITDAEDEHLEFKEAHNSFEFEKLVSYCCALANEKGGRLILGVTDRTPRRVVGTRAFQNLNDVKHRLLQELRLRVEVSDVAHEGGRVLVFEVPSRPIGTPLHQGGTYWMRSGESLVPMSPDQLRRIFEEGQPDFSAEVCPRATLDDLDPAAIEEFRRRWAQKARRQDLLAFSVEQLLVDADLFVPGRGVTYAALVLLGTKQAMARLMAQAEVIFEYRANEASIPYQQRQEYRRGFLLFHDELWGDINAHNEVISVRENVFRRDIPAFNENAVREAVLNAVCHRDYRLQDSTFVRQAPQRIEVVSPGGFPPDIDAENVLFRQSPRNRRLAEAMARCGLVERSGQGVDRMFEATLSEGKLPPDFSRSGKGQVSVQLHGAVQDEAFVTFLDRLTKERQHTFQVRDLVVLDAVHRDLPVPAPLADRVTELVAFGALERVQRRLVLSRSFYVLRGNAGEHTRRVGLDRETRKALLLKHIGSCGEEGAPREELAAVLPGASANELKVLLRELKEAGRAHVQGTTRAARWHLGPGPSGEAS